MAKKQGQQHIRKLSRVGGGVTYSITLPIETIREFGWQEKQKLLVRPDKKRQRIIISDWPE